MYNSKAKIGKGTKSSSVPKGDPDSEYKPPSYNNSWWSSYTMDNILDNIFGTADQADNDEKENDKE